MVVLILAIFFILCVYPLISIHKNKKDVEEGIEIGREFDKNSLYEELQNRSFSYPLLKRIKKGYNGWPALEGRISTYIIYSEGTKIFVKDFKEYEGIHKEYFSLLDKKIMKTYIEKFFNKDRDVVVNSKGDIAKICIVKIVKALCIAVVLIACTKGLYEKYEVFKARTSYLEVDDKEYKKYTIEDVADNFFYSTDWVYSKDKNNKYVTLKGKTSYNDETINIDICFSMKDGEDFFPIENVYVNDKKVSDSKANSILKTIFNGYE